MPPPPPSPGAQFGRYVLEKRIGKGGMAEVFTARYRAAAGVTKRVVLKKILPHRSNDPEFVQMFISEAKLTASLSHGNLVQVFDFGELDGSYFLAMEYVEGVSLAKLLHRAEDKGLYALPAPFAVTIIMEACKGLHYAHTKQDEQGKQLGIVHRDVTPENILLSFEGQVKVADFGVAKAAVAGRAETEPGMVKSKLLYLSPEQARGENVDARTDVFALGVCLFRMLCGSHPFGGSDLNVMNQIAFGGGESPRELNPELNPELEQILLKAMARERKERYASAQALLQALSTWLNRFAPAHPADGLQNLVGFLYTEELRELSRPVAIPKWFLEMIPLWQKVQLRDSDARHQAATAQQRSPSRPSPRAEVDPQGEDGPRTRSGRTKTQTKDAPAPADRRAIFAMLGVAIAVAIAGTGALLLFRGGGAPLTARIETEPPGAQVTIDGVMAEGVTPLEAKLSAGVPHQLVATMFGHKPWTGVVNGQSGELRTVFATLTKITRAVEPESVAPPPVEEVKTNLADVDQAPARFMFERSKGAFDIGREKSITYDLRAGPWRFSGWGELTVNYDVSAPRGNLAPRKDAIQAKLITHRLLYARYGAADASMQIGLIDAAAKAPVTLTGPSTVKLFIPVDEDASVKRLTFKTEVVRSGKGNERDEATPTIDTFNTPFARPIPRRKVFRVKALDPSVQYELSLKVPPGVKGAASVVCSFGRKADEARVWENPDPLQLLKAPATIQITNAATMWCAMFDMGPGSAEQAELQIVVR